MELVQGRTMSLRIDYRRRPNARRYILRVNDRGDGGCVTIPRGGSWDEARRFAQRNLVWLEDHLQRRREKIKTTLAENHLLFRGEPVPLETLLSSAAQFQLPTSRKSSVPDTAYCATAQNPPPSLLIACKKFLWQLARVELPQRVQAIASDYRLVVQRVTVRDQRSRWGSCSARGVISLNWRLVQTPEFVRDYIIIHELMHLREMNHSARFWAHVHAAYPRTFEAERWLKTNAALLRSGPPHAA